MTKKKQYESKEFLIANYERIAAEMDAALGPHITLPLSGRPRKRKVRTSMVVMPEKCLEIPSGSSL